MHRHHLRFLDDGPVMRIGVAVLAIVVFVMIAMLISHARRPR